MEFFLLNNPTFKPTDRFISNYDETRTYKPIYEKTKNFKFNKNQRAEIYQIIGNKINETDKIAANLDGTRWNISICDNKPKRLNDFIEILEDGISLYLSADGFLKTLPMFQVQSNEVRKVVSSIDKLKGNINLLDGLDKVLIGNCNVRNDESSYEGDLAEFIDITLKYLDDLKKACLICFDDDKKMRPITGYKSELLLVQSIEEARLKTCAKFKISKAPNSTTARLINKYIQWLDIKSNHNTKREIAGYEIETTASGEAIIYSWLRRKKVFYKNMYRTLDEMGKIQALSNKKT